MRTYVLRPPGSPKRLSPTRTVGGRPRFDCWQGPSQNGILLKRRSQPLSLSAIIFCKCVGMLSPCSFTVTCCRVAPSLRATQQTSCAGLLHGGIVPMSRLTISASLHTYALSAASSRTPDAGWSSMKCRVPQKLVSRVTRAADNSYSRLCVRPWCPSCPLVVGSNHASAGRAIAHRRDTVLCILKCTSAFCRHAHRSRRSTLAIPEIIKSRLSLCRRAICCRDSYLKERLRRLSSTETML